jgi:signal transduction histidine kinase
VLLLFVVVNLLILAGTALILRQEQARARRSLQASEDFLALQRDRARGVLDSALADLVARVQSGLQEALLTALEGADAGQRSAARPSRVRHLLRACDEFLTSVRDRAEAGTLEPLIDPVGELATRLSDFLLVSDRVQDNVKQEWLRPALALWDSPLWDDPELNRLAVEAVVVRRDPRTGFSQSMSVPPHLSASSAPTEEALARDLIEDSRKALVPVMQGDRVASTLEIRGDEWGGVVLRLRDTPSPVAESGQRSSPLFLAILILLPAMGFLLFSLWQLLQNRILDPIENLGEVAMAISKGDYSRRLRTIGNDEVAIVMASFNRMMELVEGYRDELEDRVVQKTLEIESKNRELMLGQRLAATGTLAAGVAHEINNPLAGMLNVVHRLEREDLRPEQRQRYVQVLQEGIERIGSIVRQLLAVSPRKVNPAPVSLEAELQRALVLTEYRAQEKDVTVLAEVEPNLPPVLGEANELGQVFLNLLINAVDASFQGGTVVARLKLVDSELLVEIEDRGTGMSKVVADQAFDLFFTTKDAGEGTGLGLATVHHIVESHGGRMSLQTELGVGTSVRIQLPVMEKSSDHAYGSDEKDSS